MDDIDDVSAHGVMSGLSDDQGLNVNRGPADGDDRLRHEYRDTPRVLLWGDSLTEGRPGVGFVPLVEAALPFVTFENYGHGGDTVRSLKKRLLAIPLPPTGSRADIAVLWVGVNDVMAEMLPGYGLVKSALGKPPTKDLDEFSDIFSEIVDMLKEHAKRIIVLSPLFIGEDDSTALNRRLDAVCERIERMCINRQYLNYVDLRVHMPLGFHKPSPYLPVNPWARLAEGITNSREEDYDGTAVRRGLKWTYDGVHFNSLGAKKVAEVLERKLREELKMEKPHRSEDIDKLIKSLQLEQHPEGGWFKETYASELEIDGKVLDRPGSRRLATSIYFLLSRDNFSAFHRLKSDEIWYFHEGDALEVLIIHPDGGRESRIVGRAGLGFQPQTVVPAGSWFGSRVYKTGHWSLVGCAVNPGFHFDDFELADRGELISLYPQHTELIRALTRT